MPKEYRSNVGIPFKIIINILIMITCCLLIITAVENKENSKDTSFYVIMILGILVIGSVISFIIPNTKSVFLLDNGLMVKSILKRHIIRYSQIKKISNFTNYVSRDFKLTEIFKVEFKSKTKIGKSIYFSESNFKNKNETSVAKELAKRVLKNSC